MREKYISTRLEEEIHVFINLLMLISIQNNFVFHQKLIQHTYIAYIDITFLFAVTFFFSNNMLSICSVFFIQLVYSLSMIYCKRETPDTRSNNKSKTNRQRHAKKNIIENSNLNITNPNKILRNIGLCTCLSLLVMIQHKILRNMGLCT